MSVRNGLDKKRLARFNKIYIVMSYPTDEVGNRFISDMAIMESNINPYTDVLGDDIVDSEKVTVNDGFFQKLISFFKNLFGMDRTVVQ